MKSENIDNYDMIKLIDTLGVNELDDHLEPPRGDFTVYNKVTEPNR